MKRLTAEDVTNKMLSLPTDKNGLALVVSGKKKNCMYYGASYAPHSFIFDPDKPFTASVTTTGVRDIMSTDNNTYPLGDFADVRDACFVAMEFVRDFRNNMIKAEEAKADGKSWSEVANIEFPVWEHAPIGEAEVADFNAQIKRPVRSKRPVLTITTQQALFNAVQKLGVKFKNSMSVATELRNRINAVQPKSNFEYTEVAERVVIEFVAAHPEAIV